MAEKLVFERYCMEYKYFAFWNIRTTRTITTIKTTSSSSSSSSSIVVVVVVVEQLQRFELLY